MTDLTGRRALITGGARGIGRAIAQRLAAEGAHVAVTDVDEAGAKLAAEEIGRAAIAVGCDVRSSEEVRTAVENVVTAYGGLDILVNNAGVEIAKPIMAISDDEFTNILDVNIVGTFRLTKAVVPAMSATGGTIVNISSVAGTAGAPLLSAYCASKGAIIRFTESSAIELRQLGIRVNAVCPGIVATDMAERLVEPIEAISPIRFEDLVQMRQGRAGSPGEVADLVAFLVSDGARFITGAHYLIDGGLTASLF